MRLVVILAVVAIIGIFIGRALYSKNPGSPASDISTYKDLRATIEAENEKETARQQSDLFAGDSTSTKSNQNSMTLDEKLKLGPPSGAVIDPQKTYAAVLKTTVGDITIALNAGATPQTVSNFVYLARKGFYDNTIFHRAIKGFMIQGGDPKGDGTGGPAYRFGDEKFSGDYSRGTVAMANAGPNTNGSQFFIMHDDYPLPPNYVIFGKVTSGLDAVDKIAEAPVTVSPSGEKSKPVNPVTVQSVEIKEN